MDGQVLQALSEGATLITANQRLSRALTERFDGARATGGEAVWRSADILHLSAWLRRGFEDALYGGAADDVTVPSAAQRALVWERIIAGSTIEHPPLQLPATAAAAIEAWDLLHQWLIAPGEVRPGRSVEIQAFLDWCETYRGHCREEGWLDSATLPEHIIAWADKDALELPRRILLAGFDDFTPQQQALWKALEQAGCGVQTLTAPSRGDRARRTDCADEESELRSAVWWARQRVQDRPGCRIALVIPDLSRRRGHVEQVLQDLLTPEFVLHPSPGPSSLYNISEGEPLSGVPVIHAALNLLALGQRQLELTQIGRMLRSPFVGSGESERNRRALLDARLRRRGERTLSLRSLQAMAAPSDGNAPPQPWHCPQLSALLTRWQEAAGALHLQRPPSEWARTFAGLAAAMGWPGERGLSSPEQQAVKHWPELLDELASLDSVLSSCPFDEALQRLERAAGETIFQPEGRAASIQVLGILEASGLEFDHLWALGLHDEVWPRPLRPNPFLPLALQRTQAMPRASAARELAYTERITARLLASAPDVVMSAPLREGDRDLRPSPLIAGLPLADPPPAPPPLDAQLWERIAGQGTELETLTDSRAPAVAAGTLSSGGTGVFRDQAACPFRAFAAHRLHARELEEPGYGIAAMERGNIAHAVMQGVWEELKSHAALCARDEDSLRALAASQTEKVLAEFAAERPSLMPSRLQGTETGRITAIVMEELALERQRLPFTVQGLEQSHSVEFGGITVNTRIDRIDRLEGGGAVVIDYKSGESRPSAWFGERPREPQLPLYCSSGELDVRGVAFGRLARGATGFSGLTDGDSILPGADAFENASHPRTKEKFGSREAVLAEWRGVLERLGEGFGSGFALVDPRDGQTCRYCPLPSLCRISESARRPAPEDAEQRDLDDDDPRERNG